MGNKRSLALHIQVGEHHAELAERALGNLFYICSLATLKTIPYRIEGGLLTDTSPHPEGLRSAYALQGAPGRALGRPWQILHLGSP